MFATSSSEIILSRKHQFHMADTHENGSGESRLDRMERLMAHLIEDHARFGEDHDRFQLEHKQLLTAQVVLTDRVDKLAVKLDTTITAIQELTASQRHTDERLNALIAVVDDIVRGRPPQ
jgi:hypothetical protein